LNILCILLAMLLVDIYCITELYFDSKFPTGESGVLIHLSKTVTESAIEGVLDSLLDKEISGTGAFEDCRHGTQESISNAGRHGKHRHRSRCVGDSCHNQAESGPFVKRHNVLTSFKNPGPSSTDDGGSIAPICCFNKFLTHCLFEVMPHWPHRILPLRSFFFR